MNNLRVHVAVGIVYNAQRKILIALRPADVDHGSLWEFPGGKIEAGETVYQALVRELQEEIGIQVLEAIPFMQVDHQYPHKHVLLEVWQVEAFSGEPRVCERQGMVQWVTAAELANFKFPAAADVIIAALKP